MSPAELAQLEHAFATDPTSDAYKPLAEAYLAMGRFMEAMVVCKKGVKAHPDTIAARVLLARVYAEQGKDKKALEELTGALQQAPNDLVALRLSGSLLCKTGDLAQGSEHLKKAIAADPKDAETIELCKKYHVAVPAPEPPPAPPRPAVVAPPPQVHAPQPTPQAGVGAVAGPGLQTPVQQPYPPPQPFLQQPYPPQAYPPQPVQQPYPAQAMPQAYPQPPVQQPYPPQAMPPQPMQARPVQQRVSAPRPPVRPSASRQNLAELAERLEREQVEDSFVNKQKHGMKGLIVTVALILVGALGLAGFFIVRKHNAEVDGKIAKLLKQMQDELAHDSYASYKKACELGTQIVTDLDPKLFSAHAYLAYAYAIRWGEHGEDLQERAKEHLAKAQAAKIEHSHILAAKAYITFFGGDTAGAEKELAEVVEQNEQANKKSTLLMAVLGILQMHSGDLEKAYKNLKAAQTLAPADPRINAALGDVLRRQGNEFFAANAYETALRYERDHAEAQLGVALMAIDTGKYETAEKYVKKLLTADPPPSSRQLAVAHLAHALVLDEANKSGEADKEQELAFATDSGNAELFILKARRLTRAKKPEDALAAIREAIKRDPKRASFQAELAKALITKPGGAKEAVAAMKEAVAKMGNSPKLLSLLGEAQKADNDLDGADQSYQKAIDAAKDKKWPEAQLARADIARQKKDFPKALELYEKSLKEFMSNAKKQAYALTEMGKIYEEQQDRKTALDKYKAAAGADATFGPPNFLMAKFFVADKDKAKRETAYQLLDRYMNLDPNGEYSDEAKRYLGTDEARRFLKSAEKQQ